MKPLSRRAVLRGIGCAIVLPSLEAMTRRAGAAVLATGHASAPKRMAFVFFPNGVNRTAWFPNAVGALGETTDLPSSLAPLAPFKNRLTVLSGLAHVNAEAQGDGPGDHARSAACFLTGAHPKKTAGGDITNGISIDQVIASRISGRTRFDSLEIGLEPGMTAGQCDSGYSCAYSANISWRTPHTPMAKEHDPRVLFERIFAAGPGSESAAAQAARIARRRSILDGAQQEAARLHDALGANDRRKLDEYLEGVRAIERRIELSERSASESPAEGLPPKPAGVPATWHEHARLMIDLMVLAFRTDSTRIATFMLANEGSNRPYPAIDVRDGHHDVSHHGASEDKLGKFAAINRHHTEQFAYLMQQLTSERDATGASLLDATMLVYGGAIGDGNRHDHRDLPVILAGGAPDDALDNGLGAAHGSFRALRADTPLCDLYLSLARRMGVSLERFGDSRGALAL
ncbi:MAG: DUF1552 domain-containing protein [Phycisphaerae bacterium]|nr:DUF1552 domain-containing protein [Phycisphaerae bacterium]